jgi:NAD(P)H-hydrate repair Nnr-like enzyme with NAD(P)H-hydrate dehydratase domain
LLAQSYSPLDAAIMGVYLHGLAADIGAPKMSYQAFIASDIIENIGNAYIDSIP